jgi:iron complex outermembrane receptor protein
MNLVKYILTVLFIVTASKVQSQSELEHKLDDIIVTAGRTPISFKDLNRNVIVISVKEIEEAPVNSIQELLQYVTGVDLKQRGADEVQSDISIRGGTFEQTLILLDGIKMNDQQTGHHNLNLPLSLDKKVSDGYRFNTDFDIFNFSYNPSLKIGQANVNFMFGFQEKDFGASRFYVASIPNEAEQTKTRFLSGSAEFGNSMISVSPKVFWRRHNDEWSLDFTNPAASRNIHETDIYGFEIQSTLTTTIGKTSIGGEFSKDKITSNNLGKHSRERKGFFFEQNISLFNMLSINFGGFAYKYELLGWKFWPGFDLGINVLDNLKLYGSYGKSFRIPSYTELYFSIPNFLQGNENLKPEEAVSYEVGLGFNHNVISANVNFFRREGKNIIDWSKSSPNDAWKTNNINRINTNGVEFTISFFPQKLIKNIPIKTFNLGYSYLDSDKSSGEYISRYVLQNLDHQLSIKIINELFYDILQSWYLRYEERANFDNYFIIDSKISKKFGWLKIFIKATNLFNESYTEFNGFLLPGRWLYAGAEIKLFGE